MIEQHRSGWLSNRPIQTKLLLAFGAILLAFLLAVVAILFAMATQTESRRWTQHTHEVIDEVNSLVRALQDADLDVRNLAMSGGARQAGAYQQDVAAARQRLAATLALTTDNPVQQTRLRQVDAQLGRWVDQVADPAVAEARASGADDRSARFYDIGRRYLDATHPM